jgi:hypothetical protein
MRCDVSLYIEFVGSLQVQRISKPWMMGTCEVRNAIEEKASWVMGWAVLSSTSGCSEYRRAPVTMMTQNRNGDWS